MKQRELVGFWIALAILGAVAILTYRSTDATAETLRWVERTHHVLEKVEDVSSAYARAASARRSYVVIGDSSQLGATTALDARMNLAVETLKASVVDNSSQLHRIDSLAQLLNQRIADLDRSVERRRRGEAGVETAEGLTVVAEIRSVRESIEKEENRLLAERDATTRQYVARIKVACVAGTFASFAILLFAFGRLRQEIGRRRESERGLRASESFLDSIVENIPNMIVVKDAGQLRFERINRAGEALLGIGRADLLRKSDADFSPRDQAQALQLRDRETLSRGVVEIVEEEIQTQSGPRWVHTKKVPIVDEEGIARHLLAISEDITERRQSAERLRSAKEATDAANRELEAFSYSVAHDLRAPLRGIDGFCRAIEEDAGDTLDSVCVDHLGQVRASARHMAELIDGLLGLSRITRGELLRQAVDLTRFARESIARLREAHPERSVEVTIPDGLVADGDARLIRSALDNLLGNAWKFTGKCAAARIEMGKLVENGATAFFIRDNGAGFDQVYAGKLFGAFQRLHGASEFEGSGIGLATVQRIIRRHGGRIWAEGAVGKGATFYFAI